MDKATHSLLTGLAILVSAIIFLTPRASQAQESALDYVGFQGGIAQTTFGQIDSESRQGFTGGLQFIIGVNEVLSVELDALYSRKGAKGINAQGGQNVSDAFDYSDTEIELTYAEFPLMLKITAPIDVVKVRAMAGPKFSIMNNALQNGSETITQLQSQQPVDTRFLDYDIGAVFGGEVALPLPVLGGSEVALVGRYDLGLKNIDTIQGFEAENRSFSGSLAFRIPIR